MYALIRFYGYVRMAIDEALQRGARHANVAGKSRHDEIRAFNPCAQDLAGVAGVVHRRYCALVKCLRHLEEQFTQATRRHLRRGARTQPRLTHRG